MPSFESLHLGIKWVALGLELAGVAVIVCGAVATTGLYVARLIKGLAGEDSYHRFHSNLGKAILLGLEFLVAADIVRTVAAGPTLQDLGVLGVLVLIRTFLSFALQVEISGRWPWRRSDEPRP
jgi:uncharacterized membrane protein